MTAHSEAKALERKFKRLTRQNGTTYKIVRHYRDRMVKRVVRCGLTLSEAQAHCSDPETSSTTAVSSAARKRTTRHGAWFDGYTEDT